MKFSCPGCRAVFTIADEKLPETKELRISCPRCRNAIELNIDDGFAESAVGSDPAQINLLETDGLVEDIPPAEIVEEGLRSSLICISPEALSRKMTEVLRDMDFYVSEAANPKAAINRLRHNSYDLVVLNNASQVTDVPEDSLLQQINLLPIHVRRRFFLCALSEAVSTFDQLKAFKMGVNLILNSQDLDRAAAILKQAMKSHENSYRLFREELTKKGQL